MTADTTSALQNKTKMHYTLYTSSCTLPDASDILFNFQQTLSVASLGGHSLQHHTVVSTMPSFHPKNATSWMQWQLVLLEQMPQGLLKSITPTLSTCSSVSSTQPAAS
jgi:hypothetical protein